MSLHDFREAVRERASARVLLGWVVVAAVFTVANGWSVADFALLLVVLVAASVAPAVAAALGVPAWVRSVVGGCCAVAFGAAALYGYGGAAAPLTTLLLVGFVLAGVVIAVRAVRDSPLTADADGETA
ncbi:hypothetical protein [Halarchaeum acidiphilum]|uniref:hypothetical protein n=2 Tax=Halarchaeum acidiphilum TaxID=489138 RepID=UPI0011DE4576|nr:hypothetical protein [Halarchaeum acidiphilum]